jgi:[acyl-carrier-protein] S-malonyltransferase
MAEAANLEPSGMAALLGADEDEASAICEKRRNQGGRLQVANLNAPGQIVVAGGRADIEWLVENARDLGVRRAIPLKVGGAFHSSFMEPAATGVADALAGAVIGEMAFPVWSNTTARPHESSSVKETLSRQVVEPVLFAWGLEDMAAHGIDTFIHVGPGDVTAGLARRTIKDATVLTVSSPGDVPEAADVIVTMGAVRGVADEKR